MFNKIKRFKLHQKIFLAYSFVFLIVMTVILMVLWKQISNAYRNEIEHEARNVHSQIERSYEGLKREIQDAVNDLTKDYRVLTAIQSGSHAVFPKHQLLEFLEYGNENGLILESTYHARRGIVNKNALSAQNNEHQFNLGTIGDDQVILQITMPIQVNKRFYGFVTGGVYLRKRLSEMLRATPGRLFFLRLQEEIYFLSMTKSPHSMLPQIDDTWSKLFNLRSTNSTMTESLHSIMDSDKLKYRGNKYSISRVPLAGQAELIVAFSQQRLIEQQNKLVSSLLFIALAGVIAMYLAGYLIARQITRPIGRLTQGAIAVSKGNLDYRISVDSHDEIGLLAEQFNQMAADIKIQQEKRLSAERIAAWRDVARMVAHEVKNPLFPIQLSIESLQKSYHSKPEIFDEIFDECVDTVMNELDRLLEIIEEFHQFAKMPEPQRKPCDVNALIKETLTLYSKSSENIEIVTELGELPTISIDPEQFSRVFQNLIKNAIEAMPQGGKLMIFSKYLPPHRGGKVQIGFVDTGVGMDEETQRRIFEPYYTTKEKGTGLGMALVQRVILEHHGSIKIDSAKDKGTRIVIEIAEVSHFLFVEA